MIISHEHRYVFIEIPKNASQSIRKFLLENCNGFSDGVAHNVYVPEECKDYLHFCVIRNPYSRFVSLYDFICDRPKHRCHELAKELGALKFAQWMADRSIEPALPYNEKECNTCDHYKDGLFRGRDVNQYDFLSGLLPNIRLIRFESLTDDLKQLPFIGNSVAKLEHLNVGKCVDWKVTVTPEVEPFVFQWAKGDFDHLGFQRLQ